MITLDVKHSENRRPATQLLCATVRPPEGCDNAVRSPSLCAIAQLATGGNNVLHAIRQRGPNLLVALQIDTQNGRLA